MARTVLTTVTPVGPYVSLPISANSADFTFTAADNAAGNEFTATGKQILLVQNTDAGAQTFTISSVADALKRTGDVGPYSMAAGEFAAFLLTDQVGYHQSDGNIYLDASAATIKFCVLNLP